MKTILLCGLLFFGFFGSTLSESCPPFDAKQLKIALGELETARVAKLLSADQIIIKRQIEAYFADVPEMVRIAGCESSFRQFEKDGGVVISPTGDYGLFQINKKVWHGRARELGLDYEKSTADNLRMARHIYEKQGLKAWTCSKIVL